ncbi:unnamed protein product [Protopolystoma xenopodis]|uniref:ATPase AAA-type core domain-containing protein n=1 Tax=Protopolystoma xenopodis TaxID=117903 RepID=A0A3S5BGI4_9PLAT|nr:unnamed protein product [Protopolystoma xenopodis]
MDGIIKPVPPFNISDYLGEYSYLGTTLRQVNIEPQPSLADVRRLITEYAILPLGCQVVRDRLPLIKSILLVGPVGTGKRSLVNAVCTATGANLFDLSADNLMGKYPGREGLKMLMHLVFKVAKLLNPSVILVRDADKMFRKRTPKTDLVSDAFIWSTGPNKLLKGVYSCQFMLIFNHFKYGIWPLH